MKKKNRLALAVQAMPPPYELSHHITVRREFKLNSQPSVPENYFFLSSFTSIHLLLIIYFIYLFFIILVCICISQRIWTFSARSSFFGHYKIMHSYKAEVSHNETCSSHFQFISRNHIIVSPKLNTIYSS